jgi:hypothetical protein
MNTKSIIFLSIFIRILLIYWLSNNESSERISLTDIDYKVYT